MFEQKEQTELKEAARVDLLVRANELNALRCGVCEGYGHTRMLCPTNKRLKNLTLGGRFHAKLITKVRARVWDDICTQ